MKEMKREMIYTTPNEGASMNPVPKAVMISNEELLALSVMSSQFLWIGILPLKKF